MRKNRHSIALQFLLIISVVMAHAYSNSFAQNSLVNIANGGNIYLSPGAVMKVNGGLKISAGATLLHDNAGVSNLWMSGDFRNLGTYTQNQYGLLRFFGSTQDSISGNSYSYPRIWLMKTGSGMVSLSQGTDITISQSLRLIGNSILNIHRSNLIIEPTAMIYPDSVSNYSVDPLSEPFNATKFIMTSGEKVLSGAIVRKLPQMDVLNTDYSIRFPIGTPSDTANPTVRNYSPSRFVLNAGEATTGSNAFLSMRCIASEHSAVEVRGVSLKKYWKTGYNNIFVKPGGYNVRFNYHQSEVLGTEELYMLCLFFRPFDGLNGTYYINAGAGYGIEPVNNRFYVDEVNRKDTLSQTQVLMDGEWTAGQAEAVSTFYYSIKNDGDWYDPTTWSKQGFNGVAANTYPSTLNDKVFIGNNKTVIINKDSLHSTTPAIKSIIVQNKGRLKFGTHNAQTISDSLVVEPGGTLAISSPEGITTTGNQGNVQSNHRIYSQSGIYEYIGGLNQVTGMGLPDIVASLLINKTSLTDTLSLVKSVLIKDSLVINQGTFHLYKNGNFTSNGETADTTNRRIIMRGGEFVMQNFPTKYKNPIFTAGTITFDGTGSFRIPSSTSPGAGEPAVTQYANLKLRGARGANTYVTLDPSGEIRISDSLNISGLTFNPIPISDRFIVTGSTIAFNGIGNQYIPTGYTAATALIYRLRFHNLNIAGSGNKYLMPPNDSDPNNNFVLVRNFVNLKSGTLVSNNHHIKVLNSWYADRGAVFNAGSGLVTFEADGKTTNIQSNGILFNNLNITGTAINGVVNYLDSLNVGGNLTINPANLRDLNSTALLVQGNFINQGTYTANTGRLFFNGAAGNQTFTHSGKGDYYNITVNKAAGNVLLAGDSLIKVSNNLTLTKGNIGGRNSGTPANKPIIVDGTITRPGTTPGHIDGRLRFPVDEGAFSRLLPLGLNNDYNPMQFDITGYGGAKGYLDAYVIAQADMSGLSNTVLQNQEPNGPELEVTKTVQKVWIMHADTSLPIDTRFKLGAARTYDIEFFFPASDVRNGALTGTFEIGQRDTTAANDVANIGRWSKPFMADRNPLSTKFTGNQNFHNTAPQYFILGEPRIFTYYSIADGNWNSAATWSTAGYESTEPALRAPLSVDNIRIGNGKQVTLNVNHSVNAARSVVVECGGTGYPNGHLVFDTDTRVLTHNASGPAGSSTFRLDSGAAITIRHANGISTTAGANGCIQTSIRQYNGVANHNAGNFIYARNTNGAQATGNGLPLYVNTFQVEELPITNALTFTNANTILHVKDSIHIRAGNVTFSNINTKIGGNFIVELNGQYNFGTATVGNAYPGTGAQDSSTTTNGGLMFDGAGIQNIWVKRADSNATIVLNRLSLVKPSGKIISRNNINAGQLFFHEGNRANYNGLNYNKWVWGRVNVLRVGGFTNNNATDPGWTMLDDPKYGYVEGRLLRSVNNNRRQFPIGTLTKYAPLDVQTANVQTGGNGLMEIQAVEGNHPNFSPTEINQNTNIQRYYEITLPTDTASTLVIGNNANLTFRTRLIFTQDEARGGINPATYKVFRLNSSGNWTNSVNIATDSNTANQLLFNLNTAPRIAANGIFQTISLSSGAPCITLMVGELPNNTARIFYSKNSGNWTEPSTWVAETPSVLYENTETGYALISNAYNDYPRFNDATRKDYVIIGNGVKVNYNTNNINLAYVLLEKSTGGVGELVMNGENIFTTSQFVQKNGGKLHIGSVSGITSPANSGNIRQALPNSIINYDWNDLGLNSYAYIDSLNAVQQTGNGLPVKIASLEIKTNNSIVNLTNNSNLIITDSLLFNSGTLRNNASSNTISIKGDIINNSTGQGFNSGSTAAIILDSTNNQKIRGTATGTIFPATITINKPSGTVTANQNLRFNSIVNIQSNTIFNLSDNYTATFGSGATISNIETFGVNKLFKVSGGPNTAKLRKEYPQGNNTTPPAFTFPIGEDSLGLRSIRYGEALVTLTTQTFATGNYLELSLRSLYPHANAIGTTPNMLRKYWSINTSGITLGAGSTSMRLRYNDAEVRGNILNYRPALYRRLDVGGVNNVGVPSLDPGWSFELFGASPLQIDTTNKYIIVTNALTLPNHDWTSGDPSAFEQGKTFWSIASGNWSSPNSWTNYSNGGSPHTSTVPALNSPGFFKSDKVIIGSNHSIRYDKTPKNSIDSLVVGITAGVTDNPMLQFLSSANNHKSLRVRGDVRIGSRGLIAKENATGISIDTLYVARTFENNGAAGRGVDFHPIADTSRKIRLEFVDSTDSYITGEGNYTSLATVRENKARSRDTLFNRSQSFSTRFSSAITIPSVDFKLDAGMYYHDNIADITLSTNGDGDVFLGDLVGLVVNKGNIIYQDGLICGQDASVWLLNGNLTIGNKPKESFQYESTTIIDIRGNSKLMVAGAMRRRFLTSNVDFRLKDNAQIEVMKYGDTTNSAERRAAFDFGESSSLFTMTGGKVIIYRPMVLSIAGEKDPDYYVNTAIYTVTGGTVQFGHKDTIVSSAQPFNLIASTPFWNLDLQNTYSNNLYLSSPIVTVLNDLNVNNLAILNQNGNTLNIGGDFTILGLYKSGTIGTRRVSFFGNSNNTPATKQVQSLKIAQAINGTLNEPFYDVVINKSNGGTIELSNDVLYPNSNMVLNNTLEFSIGNSGIITTGINHYVQVGASITDLATIQRFGTGHVNGELKIWVNDGPHTKFFTVGTATDYSPAVFTTSSGVGTAGLVSITAYGIAHPDINANTLYQPTTDIARYWRVKPSSVIPFALGVGRTYDLTLYFKKGIVPIGDQKAGSSFGTFEHFRRTPEWEDPTGEWALTTPGVRADSSTASIFNSVFGDYIISEIAGQKYYSRQSGNWNDINTWALGSYSGSIATRVPNSVSDRVIIGNGKEVLVNNSNPRVRSVTVEQYNRQPGKLVIIDERYLRGLSFELNDSCYLATDDAFGFTNVAGPTPNIGAVRTTNIRSFGKGTIEYLGEQSQAMGDGPVNPKTLIINNNGSVSNIVSFSTVDYQVEDSIYVKRGKLSMGNSNVVLKGNLVVDNNTKVLSGISSLNLNSAVDQYFVMNDSSGVSLYNLIVNKSAGNLILNGTADTAGLHIERNIQFPLSNNAVINARLNNKRVLLNEDTSTITRSGKGHIDGVLFRKYGVGLSNGKFEVGFGSVYTPVELTLDGSDGTAGNVSAIVMSPPQVNVSRISPTRKINYYWRVEPHGLFNMGTRKANTKFTFPASELANLTGGSPNNSVLLRKSIPTETPLWSQREFAKLTWNTPIADVQIANSNDYWAGMGEFYIGEKYRLIFYSKQDGLWNDYNSWALDVARTIPAPEGEFPNPNDASLQDSVVIGKVDAAHTINLNMANPTISGLTLLYNGKLDINNNGTMLTNVINSSGEFRLLDSATISFGGTVNPTKSIISGFSNYIYGDNSNIEFYGNQTIIPNPFGLTSYPGNVIISGIDKKIVSMPTTILGNLFIRESSSLDVQAIDALFVRKNVFNSGSFMNNGVIEIGE